MLKALVPPGIPAQAVAAGEHLEIWAGGERLYEVDELLGFGRVPSSRPLEPRRRMALTSHVLPSASKDRVLRRLDVCASEPQSMSWLTPRQEGDGFESPSSDKPVSVLKVGIRHPEVQVSITLSKLANRKGCYLLYAHRRVHEIAALPTAGPGWASLLIPRRVSDNRPVLHDVTLSTSASAGA